nr:hypothetical protein CFP56_71063 [Quercus suber]
MLSAPLPCSDMTDPYFAGLLGSNTETQDALDGIIQFIAPQDHMLANDQMNIELQNYARQPAMNSLMENSIAANDDRSDNITLAKRAKSKPVPANSGTSASIPGSCLTAPTGNGSSPASHTNTAEPIQIESSMAQSSKISDHKAERVKLGSKEDGGTTAPCPADNRPGSKLYPIPKAHTSGGDAEMAKLKPVHDTHVPEAENPDGSNHPSSHPTDVTPCGASAKRVRATSPSETNNLTSLAAASGGNVTTPREDTPNKKQRLDDLEIRRHELLKKLQQKKDQKIAAQKLFEQQQKQREEEELAHLEAERLRAEAAERRRIEAEERQRAVHERQREQEVLHEIEDLEQQVGEADAEIQKLADQSERFMSDWNEQRSLRDVERLEREMNDEEWTMEDIDRFQAELRATDHQSRDHLFNAYR